MSLKRARTISFKGNDGYGAQISAGGGLRRGRVTRAPMATRAKVRAGGKLTMAKVQRAIRAELKANQEVKYLDSSHVGQAVAQMNLNQSGHNSVSPAITPAQGTGASQRIGDAILADTMVINSTYWGQTAYGSPIKLRTYVVAFYGSAPTIVIADFLDGNTAISSLNSGVQVYDMQSNRNPDYLTSVRVLATWDTTVPVDTNLASGATSFPHAMTSKVVDLKGMKIEYDSTSGALSNVHLGIITIADGGNRSASVSTFSGLSSNAASTGVLMNSSTRLTYRDA